MKTLKEQLKESGALDKLDRAMKLINEESLIADRGEFSTQVDVDYLHNGNQLLKEFYEIFKEII